MPTRMEQWKRAKAGHGSAHRGRDRAGIRGAAAPMPINTARLSGTRMDSDGLGWTRMDSDGLGWTQMDSDEFRAAILSTDKTA